MLSNMLKKLGQAVVMAAVSLSVGVIAEPAMADGLQLRQASTKSRQAMFERQKQLMDSRLANQYQMSKRLRPRGREVVNVTTIELKAAPNVRYTGRRTAFMPHAQAAAKKYGVPEALFLRLIQQESGWNPNARSHKGATGLAQLMPGTAARMGVNPRDPVQNLHGGARYLRLMYNQFGDWNLALAAYNAGPGAVQKYRGVPPYRETRNYVRIIAGG